MLKAAVTSVLCCDQRAREVCSSNQSAGAMFRQQRLSPGGDRPFRALEGRVGIGEEEDPPISSRQAMCVGADSPPGGPEGGPETRHRSLC